LYAFPAVVQQTAALAAAQQLQELPPGTVLDGELLFVNGSAFYLAFDALAVSSRPVWHLAFDGRLSSMASLGLQLAETHQPLISATSAAAQSARPGVHGSNRPSQLAKKQQPPEVGRDTVTVLQKQHLAFNADSVQSLSIGELYPCDGLIATPRSMSYVLGMQQLLYKIQEPEALRVDLQGQDVTSRFTLCAVPSLMYECTAEGKPLSIRFDKAKGESMQGFAASRKTSAAVQPPSLSKFVQTIRKVQPCPQPHPAVLGQPQPQRVQRNQQFRHRARTMPFQQLKLLVTEAVAAGTVERSCDQATGLQVYKYMSSAPSGMLNLTGCANCGSNYCTPLALGSAPLSLLLTHPVTCTLHQSSSVRYHLPALDCVLTETSSGIADICRGLILHPATQTVVATPFPRFVQPAPEASATSAAQAPAATIRTASITSGRQQVATSTVPAAPDLTHARATFKIDGSLIIAFLWQGQVHAATRRRMDSEQARWATDFLRARPSAAAAMQPGWTYLFEAVYADNTHVVQYPFEGLVLLDAISPGGHGLERAEERVTLAETFGPGVIPVPELTGAATELRGKLSQGTEPNRPAVRFRAPTPDAPAWPAPSTLPACEGWVLQGSHGSREKLVQYSFKWVRRHAQQLHPLAVWDAVCFEGHSRAELQQDKPWPQHMRSELGRMLDALEQGFQGAQKELFSQLAILKPTAGQQQQQAEAFAQRSTASASAPQQVQGNDTGGTASQHQMSEAAAAADALADLSLCSTGRSTHAGSSTGTQPGKPPPSAMAGPLPTASATGSTTTAATEADTAREQGTPGSVDGWDAQRSAQQTAAMQAVARYMQDRQGAVQSLQETPMDMYYQRRHPSKFSMAVINGHPVSEAAPRLRRLLLECIKPNKDGSGLPGYQPSLNFQQTWAKGWAAGPQLGHAAEQPPPPIDDVLPLVYDTLITFLEPRDVVRMGRVCTTWSQLVRTHPGYQALCKAGKEAKEAAARRSQGYVLGPYSGYGHGYFYDGWDDDGRDYDDWGGYGSP
jgi:hypothetical protein